MLERRAAKRLGFASLDALPGDRIPRRRQAALPTSAVVAVRGGQAASRRSIAGLGTDAARSRCDLRRAFQHRASDRFAKQELGLVNGQFNGPAAEGREQVWVELVATVVWLLWSLRDVVEEEKATWPAWWRSRKLTPGAMRRLAAGLFLGLEWRKPEVKPRGKSPGRAEGAKQQPRQRFKVYRATA